MAYTVSCALNIGQNAYTITSVIQLMSRTNPPVNIAFPMLASPPNNTHSLDVGQGFLIQESTIPEVTRSIGLYTCASVCYVNGINHWGYVFHANVGQVKFNQFNQAMTAIGAVGQPYNTVYIAYAHLGNTDPGYQDTIANFVTWGIPTNNIVEITNLFAPQFGLNNELQIGY